MFVERCHECLEEFRTDDPNALLCAKCKVVEDRYYGNTPPDGPEVETTPREFSKAAMRDRLGVTGNEDV